MKYIRHFLEERLAQPTWITMPLGGGSVPLVLQATQKFLGDRALSMSGTTMGGGGGGKRRCGVAYDALNADAGRADSAQRASLTVIGMGSGAGTGANVGARVSGNVFAWNGYFADLRFGGNQVAIVKGVAGADTDLATAAVNFAVDKSYQVLFECAGTTTVNLRLKVWEEGTPEPVAWTITAADSTSPIAGPGANIVGGVTAAGGASPTCSLWYFSAGTVTDAAPARPVSWDEYLAFLHQQDTLRCLLAEVDVLAQDSAGAAITGRVCAANMPFVSRPEDQPNPNICYEEIVVEPPRVRRRMNEVLRGRSTQSYGDMVWENEVPVEGATGRLEDWFSWSWDGRALRLLGGHPTWRRIDFKTVFLGSLQNVYKAGESRIGFKLRGLDAFMQLPMVTSLIGGPGPNPASLVPFSIGTFFNAEPVLYLDVPLPTYIVGTPNFFDLNPNHDMRLGGLSLKQATRTILSVDAGTDVITADAAHNMVVNGTWVGSGALPAPLSAGTKYYVKSIPAGNTFTLSATFGGATIDLTTTTAGGTFIGRAYDWAIGLVQLLSDPGNAGATVDNLDAPQGVNEAVVQTLSISGVGTLAGLFQDSLHGQNLAQKVSGFWDRQVRVGEVLDDITGSVGAAWSITREGGWYLTVLDVPSSGTTAAWTINADDVRNWRGGERWLPSKVERLGYQKNHTIQKGGDLVGAVSVANRDLYGKPYSLSTYTPAESGLEQPANHMLAENPPERETLLTYKADADAEVIRLYNLRRTSRGTFLFDADAWALAVELGDVIDITYPRDGFHMGLKAMVVGTHDDFDRFGSEVEVFCRTEGKWPLASNAQPFISEAEY